MTCIAWDGRTLAADKQTTVAGMRITTTKLYLTVSGLLVGGAGDTHEIKQGYKWFEDGRQQHAMPPCMATSDGPEFIVIEQKLSRTLVLVYGRGPVPFEVLDRQFAIGSGRDFAMAAMYCGKSAASAVEVAIHFNTGCGRGVDTMRLRKVAT